MNDKKQRAKVVTSFLLALSFALNAVPARAQDLIPVSDITGGSSVFVFRSSRKSPPKRFVSGLKPARSAQQRVETARRVTRQFVTIAKTVPRRTRTKTVDPLNLPPQPSSMPKEQAARLFAGVGEYYIDKQDIEQALEFFRESLSLDPSVKNAQNGLSEALALKGNKLLTEEKYKTALGLFQESLQNNPKNAVAYFGLGEVYNELGKTDEALAGYQKALELDRDLTEIYLPLGILYYQKGEIAKADEFLSKAPSAADDSERQYFLGLVRYAQNRNQEALTAFRAAVKASPKSAEGNFYVGESLVRMNQSAAALPAYAEAIRLKPDYFEAYVGEGNAEYELGEYAAAVKSLEQARRLKNDNIGVYLTLGDAYRLTGDYNQAQSNYEMATVFIARDKNYDRDDLAEVYSKIGYVIGAQCEINVRRAVPCKWATAIQSLEKAVELAPNAADYTNLGWAYYNSGKLDIAQRREAEGRAKLDKAAANLQKAAAMNPKFSEAPLLNLGAVQIDRGEYPAAIETLKKVIEMRPDWNFANYALGTAYYKTNDFDNAAKLFRKATDKEPDYAAAWASLGYAELKRKNMKEVQKIIARLKQLNPNEAAKMEATIRVSNMLGK